MANCNKQRLNITCGTDVVLHDTLIFDGETFDPALSVGITANLVSSLGKRTALDVEVADGGLIIYVPWVERNAGYYGLEVTGTCNSKKWATYADSLIHYTRATEMGASEVTIESDYYDITQVVGFRYSTSPIKKVTATIDDEVGTPKVDADYDGKILSFEFHNMKGNRGNGIALSSEVLSSDDGGINTHIITDDDGNEHTFHTKNGRKGAQGDSFQPIEDVSGLVLAHTTGQDNTKAMTQKAVTDAVDGICEFQEMTLNVINKANFADGDVIGAASSTSTQKCWWAAVKAGDIIKINATNGTSQNMRYAYSDTTPEIGTELTGETTLSGTAIDAYIEVPSDGYIVINHASGSFTNRTVKIRRIPSASEVDNKASKKNLADVMSITNIISAESDVEREDTGYNYLGITGNMSKSTTTAAKVYEFDVSGDTQYHVIGRTASGTQYAGYAFYGHDGSFISYGEQGLASSGHNFDVYIISPSNATLLRVASNTTYPESSAKVSELVAATTEEQKAEVRDKLGITGNTLKTIHPKMTRDYLNTSGGIGHGTTTQIDVRCVVSTARLIKVGGDVILNVKNNRRYRVQKFGSDFSFLGYSDGDITANTDTTIATGSARYIKIMLGANSSWNTEIPMDDISITGTFDDNWDVFNTRTSDDGYQRIAVAVNTTDPNSCDEETDEMQDEGTVERDYGVVVLPTTYQNTGEQTRLIIYCHGAAVNYGWGVTRFNSGDIEPEYWLAEGYAIMDVEGNPFNNSDEHFYMPQAMECYVAAYQWVIEHYNIKRDGVLLGGRSMGGGMTFNLLRRECPIPVIAACPNVPVGLPTWYWNYMDKDRKKFVADHLGLKNQPTWTGTQPPSGAMTSTEWGYLKDNFEKIVKYAPGWNIITDLPDKDTLFASNLNVNAANATCEAEDALYGRLHATVKAPVKIFGVKDDTTCPYQRCAMLYYKMLLNGAQLVELRLFQSGNHHADVQNDNMRTDVTTKFGEELENIPVVYVEMLKFWRRFEQE